MCLSCLTHKAVLQGKGTVGEHALKSHQVEDLVDRVVCSYDADVPETQAETSG